jgi:hypothetical protein
MWGLLISTKTVSNISMALSHVKSGESNSNIVKKHVEDKSGHVELMSQSNDSLVMK